MESHWSPLESPNFLLLWSWCFQIQRITFESTFNVFKFPMLVSGWLPNSSTLQAEQPASVQSFCQTTIPRQSRSLERWMDASKVSLHQHALWICTRTTRQRSKSHLFGKDYAVSRWDTRSRFLCTWRKYLGIPVGWGIWGSLQLLNHKYLFWPSCLHSCFKLNQVLSPWQKPSNTTTHKTNNEYAHAPNPRNSKMTQPQSSQSTDPIRGSCHLLHSNPSAAQLPPSKAPALRYRAPARCNPYGMLWTNHLLQIGGCPT